MLIIILMVIFVVYWCLSTKIVQTKQTHLVRAFFTKVSTVTHNYEKIKKGIVRGWSTLRDPICCIFFLCVPFLKDCLFLISSWDTGTSRAACSSQDWDHGKEHLLGFPSSDSLQWLSSATLYLMDYPFCCNWWNFILFNCLVIILLKICMWNEVKLLSRVRLFATPWTVAYQAPPYMGFSRQEYWSGLPFSFSRGSSQPRDWTLVSRIPGNMHFC